MTEKDDMTTAQERETLKMSIPKVQRVQENNGWSLFFHGVPVSADGETLEKAVDDMVFALRLYGVEWETHLRTAPNHRGNADLVQMVRACNDDQLRVWLMGGSA